MFRMVIKAAARSVSNLRVSASGVALFVLMGHSSLSYAQITIGQYTLETTGRTSSYLAQRAFGGASFAMSFAEAVGGINMQSSGLVDASINRYMDVSVSYGVGGRDGRHLQIRTNGRTYYSSLPDWELRPIVDFVNSGHTAAVSLFGDGPDKESYFYPTYEKSFANTLVGLRLLQADMFLIDPVGLRPMPMVNGRVVLGEGESVPDQTSSLNAARTLQQMMKDCPCDSWILNDVNVNTEFVTGQNGWRFQGSPHYFFWHSEMQPSEGEVLSQAAIWRSNHPAATQDDLDREVDTIIAGAKRSLVSDAEFATHFQGKYNLFLQANYPVFDVARNVMQYSAVFRASRTYHPAGWASFVNEVDAGAVAPYVATPTRIPKPHGH